MAYYLAFDAGTGGGRAVLFDESGAEISPQVRNGGTPPMRAIRDQWISTRQKTGPRLPGAAAR